MCAAAVLVAVWIHAASRPSTLRWVVVGIAAGLAVLARVDLLLLVALLGLWLLWRGPRRALVPAGLATVLTLAPWWGYCLVQFGTPIPTSGEASRQLAPLAAFERRGFAQVAGVVVGGPFANWRSLRTWLDQHSSAGVAVFVVVVGLLALVSWWWVRAVRGPAAVVATLPVYAAGLMLFYVWFGVAWYFVRYLVPVAMVVTLVLAVGIARLAERFAVRERRARMLALAGVVVLAATPFVAVARANWHSLTADQPYAMPLDSYTGYRAMALTVAEQVPPGSRIGSWQSGAIGYYAGEESTVINLDGVVNPEAADATRDDRIAEYIRGQRLGWLADLGLWMLAFRYGYAKELDPPPTVTPVEGLPLVPPLPKFGILRIEW